MKKKDRSCPREREQNSSESPESNQCICCDACTITVLIGKYMKDCAFPLLSYVVRHVISKVLWLKIQSFTAQSFTGWPSQCHISAAAPLLMHILQRWIPNVSTSTVFWFYICAYFWLQLLMEMCVCRWMNAYMWAGAVTTWTSMVLFLWGPHRRLKLAW